MSSVASGRVLRSAVARTWSAELYLHGEMAGWGKVSRNSSPDFDTPLAGLEVPSFQKWMLSEKARELCGRGEPPVCRPHTEGLFLLLESLGHSAAAWRIVSRRWVVSARFPHVRCRAGGSPGSKDSEPRLLGWFSSELGGTAVSMGRLPDCISESISRSCQRRLKIPRPPAASGGDTGTLLFPPELIF